MYIEEHSMSSLLYHGYEIEPETPSDDMLLHKRAKHNKTLRQHQKESFDTEKVNKILNMVQQNKQHYSSHIDSDDDMDEFTPQPPPQSKTENRGLQKKQQVIESMDNATYPKPYEPPTPYSNYTTSYQTPPSSQPLYQPNQQTYGRQQQHEGTSTLDSLNQKLNYMIIMLEEQQDSRTNNITEEVILYSFLGIFMIFVVDTCCRPTKYIR